MNRVLGKVGIVTGAGGAIGRAIALLMAREGAKVTVSDTHEVNGKGVAEEIKGGGGEALFVKQDVTREADWGEVIRATLDRFGKLDILVNNAGVMLWKNIEDTSLEEWRWLLGVNLDGAFLGTKY